MAGRVRELEQQLDAFRGEQANLLTHIGAAVSHAVQGGHSAGVRSSGLATPEAQLAALSSLAEARNYVAQLKECADAVREVEGAVYRAELAPAEDVEAIVRLTSEAADTYGRAAAQCAALSDHPDESTSGGGGAAAAASGGGGGGVPAPQRGREAELSQRLAACRDRLRAALGARIDAHLAECGWPPPVGGGGAAAGAQPLGQAPGAGGPPGQMVGGGGGLADALQFASPERAESVAALQRLMLALTRLQRVDERVAFEALEQSGQPLAAMAGDAAPPLWAAQQLAAPLAEQLRRQFGNAAPAGRLDRPDWLLGSVLRLANELGPALDFLQSVIEAADFHGAYHIAPEFARALREGAKALLRDEKLPAIAAAADRDLWLAWVDSLIDFEVKMAAPLGVSSAAVLSRADTPLPLLRGSTLGVLGEQPQWMDAWLAAEAAAAHKALEGILFSPSSWDKAPALQAEDLPAWRCELYPPAAAEALVGLLTGHLLPRVAHIPQPEAQDRYLKSLALDVLGGAHAAVTRMLQQADIFRSAADYRVWGRRVAVCVCFCHYLEHHLTEMVGTLTGLLKSRTDPTELAAQAIGGGPAANGAGGGPFSQQQQQQALVGGQPLSAAPSAAGPVPVGGGPPGASAPFAPPGGAAPFVPGGPAPAAFAPQPGGPFFNPAQQQQQPQQQQPFGGAPPFDPAAAAADAAGGGGGAWGPPGGGGAASTAGASASSAGSAAATAARRLLARPISDFGGARREWTLKVAKAVAQGFLQHAQAYMAGSAAFKEADPAGAEAAVVSAGLVDALQWLQGALAALSLELDRDCFREALRSVAAAINRELFNSLVTEAAFTAAGARQLAVDVSALLLLFQPYAWKNAGGYFPETLDALALLNIADPNQLAIVKQAVAPTTRANNASDVLRSVGVKVLDADQADCVLALRM